MDPIETPTPAPAPDCAPEAAPSPETLGDAPVLEPPAESTPVPTPTPEHASETIPAGGQTFRVKRPSIFGRRDMLLSMAEMAGDAKAADGESDELKKIRLSAAVFEQQIKTILPVLEIQDGETFRQAALDEAGYALDDESLAAVMARIMGPTVSGIFDSGLISAAAPALPAVPPGAAATVLLTPTAPDQAGATVDSPPSLEVSDSG